MRPEIGRFHLSERCKAMGDKSKNVITAATAAAQAEWVGVATTGMAFACVLPDGTGDGKAIVAMASPYTVDILLPTLLANLGVKAGAPACAAYPVRVSHETADPTDHVRR